MKRWLLLVAGALTLGAVWDGDAPRELGVVSWERDLEAGLARSARDSRCTATGAARPAWATSRA